MNNRIFIVVMKQMCVRALLSGFLIIFESNAHALNYFVHNYAIITLMHTI